MELWNQKDLLPPPTLTFKTKSKNIDLNKFRRTLTDALKHFKGEDFLAREATILSRTIYRMKMKFRNSKEFKTLEKINRALKNYYSVKIVHDLKQFLDLLPREYNQDDTYLPAKNMLCYILTRLQGLAKVMSRIYDSCIIAGDLFKKRLLVGHFWKIAIIAYAMVSRIFILVKFCTKFICDLYGKLYSYLSCLKNPGIEWLPEGYELPVDLREWLKVPWVYEDDYVDLTFDPVPKIFDFFDLCSDSEDVQFCDEYILVNDEEMVRSSSSKPRLLKEPLINCIRGFNIEEDFEEPIEITDTEDTDIVFYETQEGNPQSIADPIDIGEVIVLDSSVSTNHIGDGMEQIHCSSPEIPFKNLVSGIIGNQIEEAVILDHKPLNPDHPNLQNPRLSDQAEGSEIFIIDSSQETPLTNRQRNKCKPKNLNKSNKTENCKKKKNHLQVNMNHKRKFLANMNHTLLTTNEKVKPFSDWNIATSTPLNNGTPDENRNDDTLEISGIPPCEENISEKLQKVSVKVLKLNLKTKPKATKVHKKSKPNNRTSSIKLNTKDKKKSDKKGKRKISRSPSDNSKKNKQISKTHLSNSTHTRPDTSKIYGMPWAHNSPLKYNQAPEQFIDISTPKKLTKKGNLKATSIFNPDIPGCSKKMKSSNKRGSKRFESQTTKSDTSYDSEINNKWESNSYFKNSTLRLGDSIKQFNSPSLILINSTDHNMKKKRKNKQSKNINDLRKTSVTKSTTQKGKTRHNAKLKKRKSIGKKLRTKNVSQNQNQFVVSLMSPMPSLSGSPSQEKSVAFPNIAGRKWTNFEGSPISKRVGKRRRKM